VADDDSVYVVQHEKCLRLDQATGEIRATYAIPEPVIRQTPAAAANLAGKEKESMPGVLGDDPSLPNLKDLVWGYLSVADDLLLGSYNVPVAAGQEAESQLICRSESKALFALNKKDGSLRWVYRPKRDRIVGNIEIAFGDGRLFLIDGTSKADLVRARRRAQRVKAELTLVALRLADGAELWRQDDVPLLGDRSEPSRLKTNIDHLFMGLPNWGHLVYADGVVLYGANAAYDAATGKKRWEQATRPGKLPVIYGDRIITANSAYDLNTGRQRMAHDPWTGQDAPWLYTRAFGCGPTAGCRHLLFFRSGAEGFFDMEAEGNTNFGGVRSGCSRTLLAAGGLLIHPQGYSGCCCSYNFQTNLAQVAAADGADPWYVFPRGAQSGRIKHLAINFGAPGDRKDRRGTAWLGFPRPLIHDAACPASAALSMPGAECVYRRRQTEAIRNTDTPWL
jgi:outer membrane protein assembly factor BamB